MLVSVSYVNATEGHRIGDEPPHEPFTTDLGKLYRYAVREWGRCTGRVYIDGPNGDPIPVGWIFVKRVEYEDAHRISDPAKRSYLQEVWITLYAREDEVTRTHHYLNTPRSLP